MEDILERVLEGIDARFAEIRYMKINMNIITVKNGVINAVSSTEEDGFAVRVVNEGIGFSATNDISNLKEIAERAVKLSKKRKNRIDFSSEARYEDSWSVEEKKKIENMDVDEKIDYLLDVDKRLGAQMKLQMLKDKKIEKLYINSEGSKIRAKIPRVEYFYMLGVMENGNFEQSYRQYGMSGGYEIFDRWDILSLLPEEEKALREIVKAKKSPEGTYDLIVGPEVAGIIAHESCGHPSEADRILGREAAQAGESFINPSKVGERIGSEIVNVVDDPTVPHSFGYYKYDEEGIPARRRYLYKDGKINEFLHNRESAGKLGTKSNGAARSSWWNREPIVRMSTTFFEPGDYSKEELFEDVKEGIYMKSFTEWNIDDIRYNQKYVGREAYLIKNGEIVAPVRRPVLEITTPGFYSRIDAIAKDLEFFAGTCGKGDPMQGVDVWMGGPHLRLREIKLR
ncbi:TldD/PmbA family protein [Candidatus Aciduliprofundum boonei]|uniref:Peptidase U62 modulator of DNA gyrase n=1 Tax=Aciduliprofundum boonei (strain DSM 19572 / T469) TaxID=439481 RepID=B5ICG5_ACIB4|nr:TldD/PmbA family protein [Candidatus Aciduliprofundum boonei]ADD09041.1 peptidase U62 modulator of DNA gyrase [Aciduliprofundum boonei T469]EDY35995.1 TldD/PmbA family [Aciduliprofundum boonei T469]HII54444.1 TldD/PmbA family protein [Candidatus Aciduliprofundum boonei]